MKAHRQHGIGSAEDDFWKTRIPFFTAQFPTYYTKHQKVWGKFHISDERYFDGSHEIIPLTQRTGRRTYIMMHPYVLEPKLTLTIGLYNTPKQYADQESAIGETLGTAKSEGFRETHVGNAQAWYYHDDNVIVLWECFFFDTFRRHPLADDTNMQNLWRGFERWLIQQFPNAKTLATPFNDPIAHSMEEYQTFLKSLGYAPFAEAAFGKNL